MSSTITDRYLEGTDGQAVVLAIVDGAGTPIAAAAIVEVVCTLESLDTGTVVMAPTDCTPGIALSRGAINGADELVITFRAADLVAVGTRAIQLRRLTTRVTHSTDKVIYDEQTFELVNLAGAPIATP